MIDDLTDKEQIELFKKWWREYGWGLVLAIVIGLSIGFGWRYWNQHKVTRNNNASQLYMQMLSMDFKHQLEPMKGIEVELDAKYQATPYPTFAHLLLAKEQVVAKNYDKALAQLDWVIANTKVVDFKNMASLRKARILTATKQYQQAITLLDSISSKGYSAMVATAKGDIYSAQGNSKDAKKQYTIATKALTDMGDKDPLLAMKMAQFNGKDVTATTNTTAHDKVPS